MSWKKVAASLKGIAPTLATGLATAVGGPVAGAAVKALSGALGLPKGKETPEAVAAALSDPDALEKVREAELSYALRMRELDVDVEQIHAEDRDSARKYYAANREWTAGFVDIASIVGFFASLGGMIWVLFLLDDAPAELVGFLGIALGHTSNMASQIVSFWRGSSSSEHKGKE